MYFLSIYINLRGKLTNNLALAHLCLYTFLLVQHSSVLGTARQNRYRFSSKQLKSTTYNHISGCPIQSFQGLSRGTYVSVGDRGALPAHHRSDLAALGSGVEVVTGALERDALYLALDTNLARSEKKKKISQGFQYLL